MLFISCSWASGTRNHPHFCCIQSIKVAIAGHTLSSLENRRFSGPEPMTLHTQMPIMPWVMEAASHEFSLVRKVSLLQDGAKPEPSGWAHLQEWGKRVGGRVLFSPHSLAKCHKDRGAHPSSAPLSLLRSPLISTDCASKGVYKRRMGEPQLNEIEHTG